MPLLLLLLGGTVLVGTGALAFNSVTNDAQRLVPSITTIAALGLAGVAVWFVVKKSG